MKKFGMVLGAAAIATLAGCKDPDYKYGNVSNAQNEVKEVAPEVVVEPPPAPKCKCPPGTKHTSPCTCGASDCQCIVETKPVIVATITQPSVPPPAPETTVYVVQSGDYLAKISKRFNVTISSIKRLNNLTSDKIVVGQKLKIPGKHDVAIPAPTAKNAPKVVSSKRGFAAYTGATKEYVVKSGDTLGAIAYGNGCNIRQLKELNGLTKDALMVGQKLKVPAAGKKAAATTTPPSKKAERKVVAEQPKVAEPPKAAEQPVTEPPATEQSDDASTATAQPEGSANAAAEPSKTDEAAVKAPEAPTYVVQEGEDLTSVSIRWGVSAAAIRELNNLPDDAQLLPGQVIKLPADAQQ